MDSQNQRDFVEYWNHISGLKIKKYLWLLKNQCTRKYMEYRYHENNVTIVEYLLKPIKIVYYQYHGNWVDDSNDIKLYCENMMVCKCHLMKRYS